MYESNEFWKVFERWKVLGIFRRVWNPIMNLESCAGLKRTYWKLEFLFSTPTFSRIWLSFVEWILRTFLSEEGGSALWFKEIKHKEELWYSTLTQQYAAGVIAKTFLSKVTFSFPALKNSCSKNVVQNPTLLRVSSAYRTDRPAYQTGWSLCLSFFLQLAEKLIIFLFEFSLPGT